MAERPDLDHALPRLSAGLVGRTITAVRAPKPVVWRVTVPGDPAQLLVGQRFAEPARRAHAVRFPLGQLELVVEPKLAGRFRLDARDSKAPGDLAVAWTLDDGQELRYRDDVQMGKVWIIAAGETAQIPGFDEAAGALDVLDAKAFTLAAFSALAKKRRDQAKLFLMDKAALDAFGNAYADEALFRAQVHPKAATAKLDADALARLHQACATVLTEAAAEIARRDPPIDEKLRDFLLVRGKHGQPCPRCGAKIRKAGVRGHDAFFCPVCQPESGTLGTRSIVDWKKVK